MKTRSVGPAALAIVRAPAGGILPGETREAMLAALRAAEARIAASERAIGESAWDVGRELVRVHDHELWKAAGHRSFQVWVRSSCRAVSSCHRLMRLARESTREDVLAFGVRKVELILAAPQTARPALAEQPRAGASVRALERARAKTRARDVAKKRAGRGEPTVTPRARVSLAIQVDREHVARWTDEPRIATVALGGGTTVTVWDRGDSVLLTFSRDGEDE